MGWVKDALGMGSMGMPYAGAPDPATGGYPVPYMDPNNPGTAVFSPSGYGSNPATAAPSSFTNMFTPTPDPSALGNLTPAQNSQMQNLITQYQMDPAMAYMIVAGNQRPSGWATAAAGLSPVAAAALEAKLTPRHLPPAPAGGVSVAAPGPLPFAGNRSQPDPAAETAAIIARLL